MINISERPPEVEDRAIPGHWEGDLVVGANNKTAIGALVERSTRFCILLYLPSGHASIEVQEAIARKMRHLPKLMRNSLTWDQGSELALYSKIGAALDMDVCFCDPRSPWQRGMNENTNGLLRQYFPKGTDLSIYPEGCLDAVAEELSDRPRKTLGWKKPSGEFVRLIEESNAVQALHRPLESARAVRSSSVCSGRCKASRWPTDPFMMRHSQSGWLESMQPPSFVQGTQARIRLECLRLSLVRLCGPR